MADRCANCDMEKGTLDEGGRVVVQEFHEREYENSHREFPPFGKGEWVALCITNDGLDQTCEERFGP